MSYRESRVIEDRQEAENTEKLLTEQAEIRVLVELKKLSRIQGFIYDFPLSLSGEVRG